MRLLLFLGFHLFCFVSLAQVETDTLQLSKQIDSLMQLDRSNYSSRDYHLYQNVLKRSRKLKYHKGILRSHLETIQYYTTHPNIDSLFYHSRKFEKHQKKYPSKDLQLEYLRAMGYILLYDFALPEYALPYHIDALRIYDENDVKTKFRLNRGIADCYFYKGQYQLAINQIQKIIKDTIHVDVRSKNVMKVSLAVAYQFLKKPKQSRIVLEEVIKESAQNQDSLHYTYAKVFQAHNFYYEKEYQKSIDSLMANFNLLKKYLPRGVVNHYEFLALSYKELGQFKNAVSAMRKTIKKSPANERPKLYDHLSSYYIKLGKKDSALYYNTQKSHIVDSIRDLEKKIYTEFYETKLDLIKTAEENEKIKLKQVILAKANNRQKQYIISLFLGIACLLIGIIAFIHYHKNNQSQKEIVSLKKNEKKILQHHIKLREDELSATLIGITNKMQGLKEIRDQFSTVINEGTAEDLKKSLKTFDRFLKNNTSNINLTERIESQYPGLVIELKELYPELSKTNIRHCLLVKLGLSIKESADLLNVNANTVKTARYRAKIKLRLSEDISLKDFLGELHNTSFIKAS